MSSSQKPDSSNSPSGKNQGKKASKPSKSPLPLGEGTGEQASMPLTQFLVYQAEDGKLKIDVRLHGETAWLTQAQMAELFQTTVPNISTHLSNIFAEGELHPDSVVQDFLTTAADGKKYRTNHYSLDAIISVGYRVKSAVATRFRIWATSRLIGHLMRASHEVTKARRNAKDMEIIPLGLRINIGSPTFKEGCQRIVNGSLPFVASRLRVNQIGGAT